MTTTMTVKSWVIDKAQQIASGYNCFIDFEREADGSRKERDGYTTVFCDEVLSESEKAIQVRLRTGEIVGSVKGWKLWIPKSQILQN